MRSVRPSRSAHLRVCSYEVLGGEHSKAIESLETQGEQREDPRFPTARLTGANGAGAFDDALLVAVSSALAKFPNTVRRIISPRPLAVLGC
jgi:hypothetical protein